MDIDNISKDLPVELKSKNDKKVDSFRYLHNHTYKKEIHLKRLNTRYIKFYKWIDKKNWVYLIWIWKIEITSLLYQHI
jgi:hypothetical protein